MGKLTHKIGNLLELDKLSCMKTQLRFAQKQFWSEAHQATNLYCRLRTKATFQHSNNLPQGILMLEYQTDSSK